MSRSTILVVVLAVALAATGGALAIVLLGGTGEPSASPSPSESITLKRTVSGYIELRRYETPRDSYSTPNWRPRGATGCEGIGGYDDMREGASVTVYDQAGAVIGVGGLERGRRSGAACEWGFDVTVPDLAFYQVEVSHRGRAAVTRAEAANLSLNLGD